MSDYTSDLQELIAKASKNSAYLTGDDFYPVEIPKGDYAVGMIEIPKNSKIMITSKDRVRMMYIGKRNRPMFSLRENSALFLTGKLEILYNTNNVREASRLMIKLGPEGHAEISQEVKISLFSQKVD